MSTCLVTGAAGFVGSHLCDELLAGGHTVVGLDAYVPYYPREIKEANLAGALRHANFFFHEIDLGVDGLEPALQGVDVIFHLAAQAGLLRSWDEFDTYLTCNVQATQRLLQTAGAAGVKHFINISTSSVYGRFATGNEESPLEPVSPYGITKLAAENLCRAYAERTGLAVTTLRLFFGVWTPPAT